MSGKALPLSLAVAGNGLKAFPGVGTVAGGLVHAVAYGLIFDALGRSLVHDAEAPRRTRYPASSGEENSRKASVSILKRAFAASCQMALEEKKDPAPEDERLDGATTTSTSLRESLRDLIGDSTAAARNHGSRWRTTTMPCEAMLDKLEHGHLHLAARRPGQHGQVIPAELR